MVSSELYEDAILFDVVRNTALCVAGEMPAGEIQSRIITTFNQPTVITTFG